MFNVVRLVLLCSLVLRTPSFSRDLTPASHFRQAQNSVETMHDPFSFLFVLYTNTPHPARHGISNQGRKSIALKPIRMKQTVTNCSM